MATQCQSHCLPKFIKHPKLLAVNEDITRNTFANGVLYDLGNKHIFVTNNSHNSGSPAFCPWQVALRGGGTVGLTQIDTHCSQLP